MRGAYGLVGVLALLGLAGCGEAASPPGPPAAVTPAAPLGPALPPRPVELRVDGIAPCALLTDVQRDQLRVNRGQAGHGSAGSPLQGDDCLWSNLPEHPSNVFLGRLVPGQGAEYALGREPLRTVDGFAATATGSIGTDSTHYCGLLVDVAPGQSLLAQYENDSHDYPGMNHQLACDKAQRLASDMLSTLRTIKQR
jgi:Protein of unknown function (DUF3558)